MHGFPKESLVLAKGFEPSNLANASSLLWHAFKSLPSPSSEINWAGFYTLSPNQADQLILGPFHGKPACQTIAFGRGVCGTAAKGKRTVRADDVREFTGHIACDDGSRSEIVVPIVVEERVRDFFYLLRPQADREYKDPNQSLAII